MGQQGRSQHLSAQGTPTGYYVTMQPDSLSQDSSSRYSCISSCIIIISLLHRNRPWTARQAATIQAPRNHLPDP